MSQCPHWCQARHRIRVWKHADMDRNQWIRHLESLAAGESGEFPPDPTLASGPRGEQRLWGACRLPPDAMAAAVGEVLGSRRGPLLESDAYLAIEVWTECELAALHALHRIARLAPTAESTAIRRRTSEAIRWHLEHTQPDNATNRPWALHAFLMAEDGTGNQTIYAETLLHNMLATGARDERLSRWILGDAARELRLGR
jgi:hypothetical protein